MRESLPIGQMLRGISSRGKSEVSEFERTFVPRKFLRYIRVTGFADRPFPLKLLTERVVAAGETLEYIQEKETNSVFA